MKKKLLLVLLIAIFVLGACSKKDDPNNPNSISPTPTQSSGDQAILLWWNLFEPKENMQPLIDKYQAEHPNVTIQYEQKSPNGDIEEYKSDLDQALNDGRAATTPDIFTIHNTWTTAYTPYVVKSSIYDMSDYYQVVKDDFQKDGAIGVPLALDSLAIIYNKTKLGSIGDTSPSDDWSDFQRQAVATTRFEGNKVQSGGFSAYYSNNTEFYFDVLNLLFMQNGVQMIEPATKQLNFGVAPDALAANDFYKSFVTGQTTTWDTNMTLDIGAMLSNNLTLYAAPSWRLIDILNYKNAGLTDISVGVADMPQLGGGSVVNWATYWGQVVSKDSFESDVAWDFLTFISQPEQLKLYDQTVKANGRPIGIIYPRQSMASEISNDQYLGPYVRAVSTAKSWQMPDGYLIKQQFDQRYSTENNLNTLMEDINKLLNEE